MGLNGRDEQRYFLKFQLFKLEKGFASKLVSKRPHSRSWLWLHSTSFYTLPHWKFLLARKNYDGELVFCVFTGNYFQMNSVIISSSPLTQGYKSYWSENDFKEFLIMC